MSKETKSDTTKTSKHSAMKATLQSAADAETAQGFRGIEVDSTPNAHYTVAGVVAGKPTPETDVAQARKVREETGIGLSGLESSAREKEGGK